MMVLTREESSGSLLKDAKPAEWTKGLRLGDASN